MHERKPEALVEFLTPYPEAVQQLTLDARLVLLEMLYPVSEIFYDAMSAVCSAFTYTGGVRDSFVNLAVYSDHVTLIFSYGVNLDDPESRLKGGGKQVRHIRLAGLETLKDPYVVGLVKQAAEQGAKPLQAVEPHVVVKVMQGPKRRPSPS